MSEYTLVSLANNLPHNSVLVYDSGTDTLKDSGLVAIDGDLQASAGTVKVGRQDMSSAGEQVVWRNRSSGIVYAPPWHIIDETNEGGSFDRFYGPLQIIERTTDKSAVLENPEFELTIDVGEVVHRLEFEAVEAHPKVEIRIMQGPLEMWREILIISQGINEVTLDIPVTFHAGIYTVSINNLDTDTPVKILGNAQTGEIAYKVHMRTFEEKALATQEYVDDSIHFLDAQPNHSFEAVHKVNGGGTFRPSTSNVAENVPFGTFYTFGSNGVFSISDNEVTIGADGVYKFDVRISMEGSGSTKYRVWLERNDYGSTWDVCESTVVYFSPTGPSLAYPTATTILELPENSKVRLRAHTTNANSSVGIHTQIGTNGAPLSPGCVLTGTLLNP